MSKLFFRYGAMSSGKSAALLQVAHNYDEKGIKIAVIKPEIDTRGGDSVISRLGIERKVDALIPANKMVLECLNDKLPSALIVDEAQFLTPLQVEELYMISKIYDVPVLAYGLRCDFQMQGFPGASRLLELADDIEELKTICRCGRKATMNVRLVDGEPVFEGNKIVLADDANQTYESVCGTCYLKMRSKYYDKLMEERPTEDQMDIIKRYDIYNEEQKKVKKIKSRT